MAVKHTPVGGSYSKKVEDGGDGQSKAKFGNPIQKPTDNLKKPSQSANKPIDSKDSKI